MFKIFLISFRRISFDTNHLCLCLFIYIYIYVCIYVCVYIYFFFSNFSVYAYFTGKSAFFIFYDQWLKIVTIYNFDIAYIRVCMHTRVYVCMCVYSVGEKSDYYLENDETLMVAYCSRKHSHRETAIIEDYIMILNSKLEV
jgi:hypothetical protein